MLTILTTLNLNKKNKRWGLDIRFQNVFLQTYLCKQYPRAFTNLLCTISLSGSDLSVAGSFIITGAGGGVSVTGFNPSGTIASPYWEDVGITGAIFIELGGAGL